MEPFYYNHMNKNQQAVYRAMQQGLTNLSDEFQIPRLEGKDLSNVFFELRLDHPEIFWASGFKYKYYPDSPNLILIPEYLFDKGKIREHQIIGPLGQGVGVCEGIAKSVKILCDTLGIWCMIALCGNNPEKGIKYRHTWNIVKIGKTYYHLDATFDNSLGKCSQTGEEIRYDYFNLDDKAIFRDHEPLIAPAPACTDSDHFYYKEKKLSFTKQEDVYKRSLQAAKKGKTLTFHWRGGYLTKEVLRELLDLIEKAGKERQKTALIKLNWPQAVLRVRYTDEPIQPVVTMEEANEGEETPEDTASL